MDDKDWYSKATTSRPRHEACFQEVTAEWKKLDWAHMSFRYENPGTPEALTPKAELVQKKQQCTLLEPTLNTDINKAVLLHKLSMEGARRHFNAAELFQVEEEFVPQNKPPPEPSMPHNEGEVGEPGEDLDADDSASEASEKEESSVEKKKASKHGAEDVDFFKENQQPKDAEPDPIAIAELVARSEEEQKRIDEKRKQDPAYVAMLAAKEAKRVAANEKAREKRAAKKAAKEAAKEEAKQSANEAKEKREAVKLARRAAEDAADAAMDDDDGIDELDIPEEDAEAFSAAQCTFKAVKGGRVEITIPYVVPNATHMLVVSDKSDAEPNANQSWKEGILVDKSFIKKGAIKMEFNYEVKGKFLENAKRVAVIYYINDEPTKNMRTECYVEGEIEDVICQSCVVPRHVDLLAAWESFEKLPSKRARSPVQEEEAISDGDMPVDEGMEKKNPKKKPRNQSKYVEVDSDYDDEGDSEDDDFEEDEGGEDEASSDSDSDIDSKSSKKPRQKKEKEKAYVLTHATIKRLEKAVRKGSKNAVYLPFFFTLMVEAPHADEAAAEHLVDAHAWTAPHYAAHWYAVLQKYMAYRLDATNGFRARMEALHAKSLRDIGIEVEAVLRAYPEGFVNLVCFLALIKKPALIAASGPVSGSDASVQETHLAEGEQMDVEVEHESGWIKITDQGGKTRCPKRERVTAQRAVEESKALVDALGDAEPLPNDGPRITPFVGRITPAMQLEVFSTYGIELNDIERFIQALVDGGADGHNPLTREVAKDRAKRVIRGLYHCLLWAGKYPDKWGPVRPLAETLQTMGPKFARGEEAEQFGLKTIPVPASGRPYVLPGSAQNNGSNSANDWCRCFGDYFDNMIASNKSIKKEKAGPA